MAKIIFGPTIAEARNKVGASVYTRNRYGAMVRAKPNPRNPQTTAQTNIRDALTAIRARWSNALTDQQRLQWNGLQTLHPETDLFAQAKPLQGDLWYCRLNLNLYLIAQPPIDTPPPTLIAMNPGSIVATAIDLPNGVLTLTPQTPCPADHTALICATRVLGPARYSANGLLRVILAQPGPLTGPINICNAWTTKFGPTNPPGAVFATIEYVNNATGARSGALLARIQWPGGPDMLYQANVQLSSAQILAIATTAVQLLPAPGPNRLIRPIALTLAYKYHTTPYTLVPTPYVMVYWGIPPTVGDAWYNPIGLLDQTQDTIDLTLAPTHLDHPTTYLNNQPLSLYWNGTAPTGGDGTLTLTLSYTVDPIT